MCCTPTVRLLIVLTLPPSYRCPLNRPPAPSALAPAQRAGAQRLCALTQGGHSQRCYSATWPGNLRNITRAPTDAIFRWQYRCRGRSNEQREA